MNIDTVNPIPQITHTLANAFQSVPAGRLTTLVVRGTQEEIREKVQACNPVYFDILPLSLEEIFIYELGGVDYEVKNILL